MNLWLGWARRCRIPSFTTLALSARAFRDVILTAIFHRLSSSLIDSLNAQIRLISRIAFGSKNVDA